MFTKTALVAETGKLQRFALRLTRNKNDADDLLQSTCVRALEKADYFQEGTNLFSWTSRIMYNQFVTTYRRKAKFETQYDPEVFLEKVTVDPMQDINAELANVKRAMMKLGPDHREILVLVCVQGMRYEEVAARLEIPVGTVRSRLSRAREQLQAIIDIPTSPMITRAVAPEELANENTPRVPAYLAAMAMKKRALRNA